MVCWCGKKCPCLFDAPGLNPPIIRGRCEWLDKCGMDHEKSHMSDVDCTEKDDDDPYKAGLKKDYGEKGYKNDRECLLRIKEVKCLKGGLSKANSQCRPVMEMLIKLQCEYINDTCGEMRGNEVCK